MNKPIDSIAVTLRCQNKIFWVQRQPAMRFMGRFHSFVGGKIDPEDSLIFVDNINDELSPEQIVAAVRETFEETGWLAVPKAPPPEKLMTDRHDLLTGLSSLSHILKKYNLEIDGSLFKKAGVWVTPSFQKIRFQTTYLLIDLAEPLSLTVSPKEHCLGEWITPADALEKWELGQVTLPPPVIYCLRHLSQHQNEGDLLEYLNRPPQIYGQPGKRIEFRHGIQLIPLKSDTLPPAEHTNLYIVGKKNLFLVDPATPYESDRKLLTDYLEHLKSDGMKPHKILLTHQHHDHVAAAKWLHETLQIPIAASEITRGLLKDICPVHEIIGDGDIVETGENWQLQAIHTPGHAPGHLCFLEKFTGTLLCGDMVSGFGTVLISPTDGGDMIQYLNSLKHLIENYDFDLLLPAHGGSIGAAKEKLQEVIDHRIWREEKVLQKIEEGAKDLDELVRNSYDDLEESYLPYARLNIQSILKKLKVENKLPKNLRNTNYS